MRHHRRPITVVRAFTLMEMMVVMFVLALLLGAIFGIVRGTVELADEMSVELSRETRVHGFARFCERTFRSLPAQSMVRLRTKQSGTRYLTQLVLTSSPSPLVSTGAADDVMAMETDEAPDGYLRVWLRVMTAEEASAWEQGNREAGTKLLLLESVATLEWRCYNRVTRQWEPLWNEKLPLPQNAGGIAGANVLLEAPPGTGTETGTGKASDPLEAIREYELQQAGKRPGLIELKLVQGAAPPEHWTFWVPAAGLP